MIVTLTGLNTFAVKQELDKLINNFVVEHGELALERIDAEEADIQTIIDSLQNLPLLASKKMVVVRDLSANKPAVEKIEQILEAAGDSNDLIIYDPQPDKRTAYYKALKNKTDLREFGEPDENKLAQWLVREAGERGGQVKFSDAVHLVRQVGTNQQLVSNELDKLLAYQPDITRQTIDELVDPLPQSRIFDLLDAAFSGNGPRAMILYDDQRAQKVEPQAILAMIAWQLRNLVLVKFAGKRDVQTIVEETRLNPFVIRKTLKLADAISGERLRRIVDEAVDIDYRSKTKGLDMDQALKTYLISLAV